MQHDSRRQRVKTLKLERQRIIGWISVIALGLVLIAIALTHSPSAHALSALNIEPAVHNTSQLQHAGYQRQWFEQQTHKAKQAFHNNEYHLVRRLWLDLAKQGDIDAAYKMGMVYDTAMGVPRDAQLAVKWYQHAAQAGHLHAQHNLAVAYANGDGVDLDIHQAIDWWQKAANGGNADSQYNLGIVYAMGVHGIKKNIAMAEKWWHMAAMQGDGMAQYNLGTLYANGEGRQKSYCEAIRWWEMSSERGVQQAIWAMQMIKLRQDYAACR